MSPRFTKALQKPAERIGVKLYTLFDDPDISTPFCTYAYLLLKRLDISHPIRDLVQEQLGPDRSFTIKGTNTLLSEEEAQLILLDAIKAKRPDFYRIIGTQILAFQHWQLCELRDTAADEEAKQKISDYLEELRRPTYEIEHLPDNPITWEQDPVTGKFSLTDVDDVELKHFMQFIAYRDSLRLARPVGRPRGGEKPKKSGRAPNDPELALRFYQAKLDAPKWNWQPAARKLLGVTIPSDLKARERLRARVARLLALGARLYHKKSVR